MSQLVYDYVLFDWDGCLAQTLEVWITAFEVTYRDYGIDLGRSVVAANFGDWNSSQRLGLAECHYEEFHATVFERVTKSLPSVKLYPGARELLTDLRPPARGWR